MSTESTQLVENLEAAIFEMKSKDPKKYLAFLTELNQLAGELLVA